MITVANCFDMSEALHLQMVLGGAGIDAFIPDENTGTLAPYYFFATGLRLQVAEEDVDRAAYCTRKEEGQ
jgi:hypothetical protein